MANLRYIGHVEKTLVDIAPLVNGTVISVDDETSARLLAAFPNEYEVVADATAPAPVEATATLSADATTTTDATTSQDSTTQSTTQTSSKKSSGTTTN